MSTPTATPAADVIVVGGGITGLTAAYEARKRGLTAIVLEASSRPGGLIDTHRADGFTIETGPDSLLARKKAGLELCRDLHLLEQLQTVTPPRSASVLKGSRLYPMPSPSFMGLPVGWRALLRYDLLSPAGRMRLALEPWVPTRRGDDDESVAAFFRRRFGREAVDVIAQPLLGGIHAGEIEQLSMKMLFPRLLELERTQGHLLKLRAPDEPAGPRAPVFVAPIGGMRAIVDALAGALGPALVTDAEADRLERAGDAWRVWTHQSPVPRTARSIVLALPAYVTSALVAPLDGEMARLFDEMPYASSAGVVLGWPRHGVSRPLVGPGFVVARRFSDVRITACTFVSSKWRHRAPDEAVLVRAFVGGVHDPSAVDLDDRTLVDVVRRDLDITLGISAPPSLTRIYRWRRASVQHNVGQLERVAAIESRLAAHPGLFVAGAGFRAVGIPDCIADARAAVERILLTRSES